jgi:hypothetical protein
MPCNASYKIYFLKVFHMYYNLICILYAHLCEQNFILVKSGCYRPTWQRCERGNAIDGLRKLEEEASFGKYAKAAQAEWTERAHDGLRAKRPGLLGAGLDGPESEEKLFPNKI